MYNISKALIAAGVATLFSLNAMAADITPPADTTPAVGPGANGEHKLSYQERIERMRSMTPEQRAKERELMRQEMRSMSPEERRRNQQEISRGWDNMTPEQRTERRKEMREHWEKMPPEEREQVRNKMKDHWKNMSPEEREARRKEMREHFKNMSPEERRQFTRDMGKRDGMPPPVDSHPGDNTDDAGRPAK
jgi:hypothetical protein